MRASLVVVAVCGIGTAVADPVPKRPTWPTVKLHAGEVEGQTMFGSQQRWITADGKPVVFVHVVRQDGKGVLRAVWNDDKLVSEQDVLVHDFGKDEMLVIQRDDGELGFQFHSYHGHPNKYLGVRATWNGRGVTIAKQQPFTGFDPTPAWLFDPDDRGAVGAWRSMASGARTDNNLNSFSHWFDDAQVEVTTNGTKTTQAGGALLAGFATGYPLLGFHVKCDRSSCCKADGAPLAKWFHVESICFSAGTDPRVRSIAIIAP